MDGSRVVVPEPADFIHDPSHEDSECAAVVVDRDSIIHAHRWYAAASQGRTDRGRRDFDRSGPGFNAAPIRAMQCIGDYCDDERRPDAIYCVLVPSGGVSIKRKSADPPLLTWRCTATRPAGMKSNVQFYDVRAQCQSTVDGGSLELPSPAALKIQSSPTTAPVLLPGNGVKPQIPRTLHVTRAQLESEDNDGDTLNEARCQYRLQLRSIHFYDLVRWRRKLRLSDSEVAVTSSLADVENGVVSTRVGFADDDEEDHLVAAEVCRVTYRVQLTHPIAGVVSIIALGFVIVAFFGIVVIGTNDRKSRMEVARHRVANELHRYEEEVASGRGQSVTDGRGPKDPSTRSTSSSSKAVRAPLGATTTIARDQNKQSLPSNMVAQGLAQGLTVDEILLREDVLRRKDAAQVPQGVSASQYIRQRQRQRFLDPAALQRDSADGGAYIPHTAIANVPSPVRPPPRSRRGGETGSSDGDDEPRRNYYSHEANGGWGFNIDDIR
jgi:hypothetical protein